MESNSSESKNLNNCCRRSQVEVIKVRGYLCKFLMHFSCQGSTVRQRVMKSLHFKQTLFLIRGVISWKRLNRNRMDLLLRRFLVCCVTWVTQYCHTFFPEGSCASCTLALCIHFNRSDWLTLNRLILQTTQCKNKLIFKLILIAQ